MVAVLVITPWWWGQEDQELKATFKYTASSKMQKKKNQAVELWKSLLCSTRAVWHFKLHIYQGLNYMKLLRLHLKV